MGREKKRLLRYRKEGKLGEGSYGKVYLAIDMKSEAKVAMKKISVRGYNEGVPSSAIREICVLRQLCQYRHPNVVYLLDVIYDEMKFHLVFEYLDQDLRHYLDSAPPLGHTLLQSYLYQILNAVSFCHRNSVLHRDIKPQNILINKSGVLKLADFGLSRAFYPLSCTPLNSMTHEVVTLWYRSPELLLGCKDYDSAVDIWSIGCIFSEMLSQWPLFQGDSEIDQLFSIFTVLGIPSEEEWAGVSVLPNYHTAVKNMKRWLTPTPTKNILSERHPKLSEAGLDMLQALLRFNPSSRITATVARDHPFFDDMAFNLKLTFQPRSTRLPSSNWMNDGFRNFVV